jgi:hypothetical protein
VDDLAAPVQGERQDGDGAERCAGDTTSHAAAPAESPAKSTSEIPAEIPADETSPFDLAPMQHAYWVGRGKEHQLGGVAAHFYNEFDGEGVDPQRLERAVRALLARHAQLRAVFDDDGLSAPPPRPRGRDCACTTCASCPRRRRTAG